MNKIAERLYSSPLSAKTVAAVAFAFSIALESPYENMAKVVAFALFALALPPLVCCILVREALGKGSDVEKYRRQCVGYEVIASMPVPFGALFFFGGRAEPPVKELLDYSQFIKICFSAGLIWGSIIVWRCLYPYIKSQD